MTTADRPLFSIIVPSYNQGRYLRQTLESILTQSHRPLEVIVVDGASKDETVEVLKSFATAPELRWISEKDRGPADAVNKGFAMARGELVGIQSADDVYYPGALATTAGHFAANPDCGLVYGDAEAIDTEGKVFYSGQLPRFSWESIFAMRLCIPQSSAFFRRSVQQKIGGWRGEFHQCDLDFWLRMIFATGAHKIDQQFSGWRVHPDQRTQAGKGLWLDYCKIIEASDDVRHAPPEIQRMAYASRHIFALDYPPPDRGAWWRRGKALQAIAEFPRSRRYIRHHLRKLFPGYESLQAAFPSKL
ncbi:MAG TPA: glycosyltransferase family 2 protein [Nevskiaceae bacterium]|nr:glycosyltransferase family 2 protein [Nevskiaceae bacterium]